MQSVPSAVTLATRQATLDGSGFVKIGPILGVAYTSHCSVLLETLCAYVACHAGFHCETLTHMF